MAREWPEYYESNDRALKADIMPKGRTRNLKDAQNHLPPRSFVLHHVLSLNTDFREMLYPPVVVYALTMQGSHRLHHCIIMNEGTNHIRASSLL